MAIYTHCATHRLNLVVVSSCKISLSRMLNPILVRFQDFLKILPKRRRLLEIAVDLVSPSSSIKKLKYAHCTHFVQHIDSCIVFLELLPAVHMTLQTMIYPCYL